MIKYHGTSWDQVFKQKFFQGLADGQKGEQACFTMELK